MSNENVSRREFLLRTATSAATGAALLPGIIVLSDHAAAAAEKTVSVKAGDPQVAQYALKIVSTTAAPDGRSREVFCYDGKIPGPVIRAKEGQTLKIKVANQLKVPSSIHWHGMHQPGTWQMDGVDGVSHPPIPPGEEFTYEFKATPAGTHWYHSHTGVQYSDGLFGPLIVDEATPPAKYDREETLLINDWFLAQSDAILAGLLKKSDKMAGMAGAKKADDDKSMPKGTGDMKGMAAKDAGKKTDGMKSVMAPKAAKPDMAKGDMAKSDGAKSGMAGMAMGAKPDYGDVPFESGLINGQGHFGKSGDSAPAVVKVKRGETLRLRLISGASTYQFRFQIDGHPLTVIASDGAPLTPVEVDSLLLSPGERYDVLLKANGNKATWIRAVTLDGNEVKAILLYTDGQTGEIASGPVVWGKRELKPTQMKSPTPVKLDDTPQEIKFTLGGTMSPYAWNINGQEWPKADPIKLAADQPVRFIMENPTMMDHPFHLHGHYFRVLGSPDNLNLTDPPEKDSINIPAKSTVVLQWRTINPGHWFFHCHIEWHLATGMARVIEIA
ncbi:MAG TPA: multicopper oxidase family protein [Pirellulales bacterium]